MRRAGYTNEEISNFDGGAWKASTVKLYTRGIVVTDKSFKTDSTKLLAQFIEEDLTIEELRIFLAVKTVLDSKEVTFEDASDLINEANKAKLVPRDVIALYKGTISSAFDQIRQALDLKSQMQQEGLHLEGLREILQASKILGGYNKVLDAIDHEVKQLTIEKENLEKVRGEHPSNGGEINRLYHCDLAET